MNFSKKKSMSAVLSLAMITSFALGNVGTVYASDMEKDTDYYIVNPYETVDWENFGQYKADFHSHTTESDGGNTALEMIEDHYAKGFDILAITDHNFNNTTWDRTDRPETNANGKPLEYISSERLAEINAGTDRDGRGMTAIPYSDEQSRNDHLNTFWADYNNEVGYTLEDSIEKADELGGISHINHPGRYTGAVKASLEEGERISKDPAVVGKYVDLFNKYDSSLVGMEIINKKDGDSISDRILWDSILQQTMPERNFVWGFSNDDTHSVGATGFSYNIMLMPENTEEAVRYSMVNGTFYAVAKVAKRELGMNFAAQGATPVIENISVDQEENSITIEGTNYNKIQWVADGEVIAVGNTIDLNDYEEKINSYVRAQLLGDGGISFTQPFGINEYTIDNLKASVGELDLNKGIKNSLTVKLENAEKLIGKENSNYANVLNAFINEVESMKNTYITEETAYKLIESANEIMKNIK